MDLPEVILVNEQDEPCGVCEKMEAHERGLLHRAFSVFIFNEAGEMLLQQRALSKYHSGGLWTNACCSHPLPGEDTEAAAMRRLREELGFSLPLRKIFDFVYQAAFDNGLTEHEFDHVFAARYSGPMDPDPAEVMAVAYRPMDELRLSLQQEPERYTAWFRIAFPGVDAWWKQHGFAELNKS